MTTPRKLALRLGILALGAGLIFSLACSSDDDDTASPASTPTSPAPVTLNVTGVDYGFLGLPGTSIAVGSSVQFKNDSDKEIHELVALRINDDEKRAVKDLLALSDEELMGVLAMDPEMVLVAPPSSEGFAVVGDGKFSRAGRYAILCFIPTGADPDAFMEAAQGGGEGPPQIDGGPPHAFQGMVGEVIVQ